MWTFPRAVVWWPCLLLLLAANARAADAFFSNLLESSPSGRYQVTARAAAADNRTGRGRKRPTLAAPPKVTYACQDTVSKRTLWTLPAPSKGGPGAALLPPATRIAVSDDGWTVLYTEGGEFIPVDLQGNPHGRAQVTDALSAEEQNGHLHQTTLGPTWTVNSLWCFATVDAVPYLLVRPYWGHRVAVDLRQGKVVEPLPPNVQEAAAAAERTQTLRWLQEGVDSFKSWEARCCPRQAQTTSTAAYLAGALHLTEATPLLRQLEPTIYNGESSLSFVDEAERKQHAGEVNPFTSRVFDLRRTVQLALRRLGEKPLPLPCTVLEKTSKGYHERIVYEPPPLPVPRAENADKVKVGMKVEEVCQLLGVPDYIVTPRWEYDLDAQPPRTLVIQWKGWQVGEVAGVEPARWQDGNQAEERSF